MFEQSVLNRGRGARGPLSMAISAAGQILMIAGMIAVPMVFPEVIPDVALATPLAAPRPPVAPPCCAAPPESDIIRVAPRPFDRTRFTAPRKIPTEIVILTDAPVIQGATVATSTVGRSGPAAMPHWLPAGLFDPGPPTPPPPPEPPKPTARKEPIRVRVGGEVRPPVLLRSVKPVYSQIAKAAHVSGTVTLEAVIGTDGRITELRVVKGHPLLTKAAHKAVVQWLYRPTLLNNEPVEVVLKVDIHFHLQ